MQSIFAIDSRGTVRWTVCIGPWALKIARNATGRRCNRFEADLWARATAQRRLILCPVLACLPFGLAICMPRAQPFAVPNVNSCPLSKLPDHMAMWMSMRPDDPSGLPPRALVTNLSMRLRAFHAALVIAHDLREPVSAERTGQTASKQRKR